MYSQIGDREAFFRAVDHALLEEHEREAERERAANQKALYLAMQRQLAASERLNVALNRHLAEVERKAAEARAELEELKAKIKAKESLAATFTNPAVKVTVSPPIYPEGTAAITLPSETELAEVMREEFEDVEPAREEKEGKQESPVRHTPCTGREGTTPGGHDICPVRESTPDSPNMQLVVSNVRDAPYPGRDIIPESSKLPEIEDFPCPVRNKLDPERSAFPESLKLFAKTSEDALEDPLVLKVATPPFRHKKRKRPPDPKNEEFPRALRYMFHRPFEPP